MDNRVGDAIRDKRKSFGYTQEQLAEILDKTSSYIGQLERGETSPSFNTLKKLTQLLAIDANLYFYDNPNNATQESRDFYLMLEQLTPEMRKLALEIIKQIYKAGRDTENANSDM